MYNPKARRSLIMKHYSQPLHKKTLQGHDLEIYSNRCVDKLFLKYEVSNNILLKTNFDGEGCAIFLASTDIVLNIIQGQKITNIKTFLHEYLQAINGQTYDQTILQEASIFDNIKNHLNRFECGKMIYDGITKLILQVENRES